MILPQSFVLFASISSLIARADVDRPQFSESVATLVAWVRAEKCKVFVEVHATIVVCVHEFEDRIDVVLRGLNTRHRVDYRRELFFRERWDVALIGERHERVRVVSLCALATATRPLWIAHNSAVLAKLGLEVFLKCVGQIMTSKTCCKCRDTGLGLRPLDAKIDGLSVKVEACPKHCHADGWQPPQTCKRTHSCMSRAICCCSIGCAHVLAVMHTRER